MSSPIALASCPAMLRLDKPIGWRARRLKEMGLASASGIGTTMIGTPLRTSARHSLHEWLAWEV